MEVGLVGFKRDILDAPHYSSSPWSFEVEPVVITEDPLASHPPKIETVAKMGARIRSSVVFVECLKDGTAIEGQGWNKAA